MGLLARLIGPVMVVVGVLFLVFPDMLKRYSEYVLQNERFRVVGVIKGFCGYLLLTLSTQSTIPVFIFIMGIVSLCTGCVLVFSNSDVVRNILSWYSLRPLNIQRLAYLSSILLGALVIYAL